MKFPYKTILVIVSFLTLIILQVHLNNPYDTLTEDLFISPTHGSVRVESNLYFVFDKALYPESRIIEVVDGNYEESIINALKNGAANKHFSSIFDYNIELENLEVVNNTCYLNFSEAFISSELWSSPNFDLYVSSLVNSLTEFKRVLRVQLMVDGQPMVHPSANHDLALPLSRNETLIYSKERSPADASKDFIDYLLAGRFDLSYALLSNESKNNYDYTAFIKYAQNMISTLETYSYSNHFTKSKETYWEVHLKFTKVYNSDGFTQDLHQSIVVISEDDAYRISLIK